MKIEEIFEVIDYEHKDIQWDGDVAYFTINDQKYVATVRAATKNELDTLKPFFGESHTLNAGNIDFSAILPDGSETQDLTKTAGFSAGKVIATVVQIAVTLKNRHNFDILLAIAKKQHSPSNYETRVHVYARVCEKMAKRLGLTDQEITNNANYTVFAVFSRKLLDGMNKVKQHMDNVKNV